MIGYGLTKNIILVGQIKIKLTCLHNLQEIKHKFGKKKKKKN